MSIAPPAPVGIVPRVPFVPPPKGNRIALYAVEGWGKTSLAAHAPNPLILMAKGEDGYATLARKGRVPAVPAKEIESWMELLRVLDEVAKNPGDFKTVVLDALGGFDKMLANRVCETEFKGSWAFYGAFGRGDAQCVKTWDSTIQPRLDKIAEAGINVLILGHSRIKSFNSPDTVSYDRYTCAANEKIWEACKAFCDYVLFGRFRSQVVGDVERGGKGKAIGGTERIVLTQRADAWDAKNRDDMPAEIELPSDPKLSYAALFRYIK